MIYRAVTFDGLTLPTKYGSSGFFDLGVGKLPTDWVTLAGGRVWNAHRTDRLMPGLVAFGLECIIVGANDAALKTAWDALSAKVGVSGTLTRTDAAGVTHTLTASLVRLDGRAQTGNATRMQPVMLTFETADMPWAGTAYDNADTPITITGTEGNQTITNAGNAPWPRVIVTLTAGSGSVTAFTFIVGSAAAARCWQWSWAGTLAATKSLVINCGSGRVTNDGTVDYGLSLGADHDQNSLLEVAAGGVSFAVTVTHSGTDPTISWIATDGWL